MLGFRVWDSTYEEMIYPDSYDNSFVMSPRGNLHADGAEECPESYIPMQSTGIKDFNGVEIFVGDIVEYNTTYTIHANVKTFHLVVDQLPKGIIDLTSVIHGDTTENWWFTVIGNVYQNPELLEKCDVRI